MKLTDLVAEPDKLKTNKTHIQPGAVVNDVRSYAWIHDITPNTTKQEIMQRFAKWLDDQFYDHPASKAVVLKALKDHPTIGLTVNEAGGGLKKEMEYLYNEVMKNSDNNYDAIYENNMDEYKKARALVL